MYTWEDAESKRKFQFFNLGTVTKVNIYVSLTSLKFGSYDAVAHFNIGKKSSILIFEKLGMVPGRYMVKNCNIINRKRLLQNTSQVNESGCVVKSCAVKRNLRRIKLETRKDLCMPQEHFKLFLFKITFIICMN